MNWRIASTLQINIMVPLINSHITSQAAQVSNYMVHDQTFHKQKEKINTCNWKMKDKSEMLICKWNCTTQAIQSSTLIHIITILCIIIISHGCNGHRTIIRQRTIIIRMFIFSQACTIKTTIIHKLQMLTEILLAIVILTTIITKTHIQVILEVFRISIMYKTMLMNKSKKIISLISSQLS